MDPRCDSRGRHRIFVDPNRTPRPPFFWAGTANLLKTKSRRGELNPGPADYESGRRCVEASLKFPLLETTIPVPRCRRTLKYAGIRRRNLSGT